MIVFRYSNQIVRYTSLAALLAFFVYPGGLLRAHAAGEQLVVTTTQDSATCLSGALSLRCALTLANSANTAITITFAVPPLSPQCSGSPAVCTFGVRSPLPTLTASDVTIDGSTQTGARAPSSQPNGGSESMLTVRLEGAAAGVGSSGLTVAGSRDVIRGVDITGFAGAGIALVGGATGTAVEGCWIGLAPDGITVDGNAGGGISVAGGASGSMLGGLESGAANVISGNGSFGLRISGGGANQALGNYVGTTAHGNAAAPNHGPGVILTGSSGTIVGGTAPGSGNVVSGNGGAGIVVQQTGGDVLAGNLVGLSADGRHTLGNQGDGVLLDQAGSIVVDGRNVISGNTKYGVEISNGGGNIVAGNWIGVDAGGANAAANGSDGIRLDSVSDNTIGGAGVGAGNIISANQGNGITIRNAATNIVVGNDVGTTAAGTAVLGNRGNGILVQNASRITIVDNVLSGNSGNGLQVSSSGRDIVRDNSVGTDRQHKLRLGNHANGMSFRDGSGDDQVSGNALVANGGAGILIGASMNDQTHEVLSQNLFWANHGLGIKLSRERYASCASAHGGGYTPCPRIDRASPLAVSGRACRGCRVELYVAAGNGSTTRQGRIYLDSTVSGARSGRWTIHLKRGEVAVGRRLTATATSTAHPSPAETSEFCRVTRVQRRR